MVYRQNNSETAKNAKDSQRAAKTIPELESSFCDGYNIYYDTPKTLTYDVTGRVDRITLIIRNAATA